MLKNIDVTKKPTKKQIEMLNEASGFFVSEDDEYSGFTDKELAQFKRISDKKRMNRQKQAVTLRLSQNTLKKAKSLGKGYTSILSRIIESAFENPDIIKRYL